MSIIEHDKLALLLDHMGGQDLLKELRRLSPKEQAYMQQIINECAAVGWSDTLTEIVAIDWEIEPASPRQFFEDPYYKGPDVTIYPMLVDLLSEALSDPMIYEIVMTGAIGYGKSYGCGHGIAYEAHRLLCMRNPQQYAGINKATKLLFMNMSVSAENADSVLYSYIYNAISNSPWFREHFPVDERTGLYWPEKNIEIKSGSSSEVALIGSNLVGVAMDEANFMTNARRSSRMIQAGETDVAMGMYNQIIKRRTSRFLKSLKGDRPPPARMWLLSSKQFPGDFLEKRIDKIEEMQLMGMDVHSYIIDCDQWTPKMSLGDHPNNPFTSGEWFPVMIGDAMNASRILDVDNTYTTKDEIVERFDEVIPDGCELLPVPSELLLTFQEDLPNAIRDICGRSIHSKRPYINDPDGIRAMICNASLGDVERVHPYEFEQYHILSSELLITDLIPTMIDEFKRVRPLVNPDAKRVVHGDMALNRQCAGIAVNHCAGFKEIRQRIPKQVYEDGELCTRYVDILERRPIIITDFMLRIVPPVGGEISLKSFRFFIYALERMFGFEYDRTIENAISFDQFQSAETLQEIKDQGYATGRFSVDRNPEAYEKLKSAIRDQRYSCYMYKPFLEDLASIERDPATGKIKKGQGRTHGDVSDCVAANTFKLEERYGRIQVPLLPETGNDNHLFQSDKNKLAKQILPGHTSAIEKQDMFDELSESDPYDVSRLFGGLDDL